MRSPIRSPIKYLGGKGQLASKLIPLFPEHNHYVEVFGGGGGLLMAKAPSLNETYNDIDSTLYDFFKVLSDPEKFEQFYRIIVATPYSRRFYKDCQKWQEEIDLIKRVSKWFIRMRQMFGASTHSWGFSVIESEGWKWLTVLKNLPEMHKRLLPVQIENLDWRKILQNYDSETTFFYLDPPYVPTTRSKSGKYTQEMTIEDHEEFVGNLLSVRGKVMLSGYPNDIYTRLEKEGWHRVDFNWFSHASKADLGREVRQRVECVWMNYQEMRLF